MPSASPASMRSDTPSTAAQRRAPRAASRRAAGGARAGCGPRVGSALRPFRRDGWRSRSPRPASRRAASRLARLACSRAPARARMRRHRPAFDDAALAHHRHVVGERGDDAHVVRDHRQRHAAFAIRAGAAARGSAPAPTRRARWSVRRRSAVWDRRRAPWRSWRAAACRPTVRADTGAGGAARRSCAPARAASRRVRAPRASSMPWWVTSGSAIWSPMRRCGVSDVIGSWKIIATRGREARPRRVRAGRALRGARGRRRAPVRGSSPIMARNAWVLPAPDSPMTPRQRPGSDLERDGFHGRRGAVTHGEFSTSAALLSHRATRARRAGRRRAG